MRCLRKVADSQPQLKIAAWDTVRKWENNDGDKGSVMTAFGMAIALLKGIAMLLI